MMLDYHCPYVVGTEFEMLVILPQYSDVDEFKEDTRDIEMDPRMHLRQIIIEYGEAEKIRNRNALKGMQSVICTCFGRDRHRSFHHRCLQPNSKQ
jgi:hypothetical protein